MIQGPAIQVPIEPTLEPRKVNAILAQLKRSLGPLGKEIRPIDSRALNAELKKIESELVDVDQKFQTAFSAGSVAEMQQALRDLLKDIDKLEDAGGSEAFADRFFKAEAIGQGAELLGRLAANSNDTRAALKRLGAQTGLVGSELERLKDIVGNVYERGGFDSMAEAIKATGTAAQQLREFLDPKGIEKFVSAAAGIATTFDKDVNEVIAKSRTFIAAFGLEGQEAGNLISLAMQEGGSGMDDVLDSLDEYSQLAVDAGVSAQQFIGILTTGVKAGARDTDKLSDALKETALRLNQGDAVKALAEIEGATARTLESIAKKAESGDISIGEAIQKSAETIDASGLSDAMQQKLQVAISNAQAEDIGVTLYNKIFSAPIDEAAITAQAARAGEQIAAAVEPPDAFSALTRKAERAFGDIAGFVGPVLSPASQLTGTLAKIGPALEAAKTAKAAQGMAGFGQAALGAIKNLLGMTVATGAQTAATTGQTVATGGATVATNILSLAMRAMPLFAIIGAVGLVAAAFGAFSSSTEELVEDLDSASDASKKTREDLASVGKETSGSDKQAQALKNLAAEYRSLEGSTTVEGQERFAAVSEELAQKVPHAKNAVADLNAEGKETSETFGVNANVVDAFADSMLKGNAVIRQGKIAEAGLRMQELAEASEDARERQEDLNAEIEEQKRIIDIAAASPENDFWARRAADASEKLVELQAEVGQVTVSLNDADDETRSMVQAMRDGKVSMEEVARVSGKSVAEIKKIAQEAKLAEQGLDATASSAGEIEGNAKGAASATEGIGRAAKNSKKLVAELAAVYEKVKSAADDSYSGAFKGILGILTKQREVKREIELAEIQLADLKQSGQAANIIQIAAVQSRLGILRSQASVLRDMEGRERAAAKEALAETRRLEAQERQLRIELGEITVEKKAGQILDFAEQAEQIRREMEEVLHGIVSDSLADDIGKQIREVNRKLEVDLREVADKIAEVKAARDKGGTRNAGALIAQLTALQEAKEAEAQAAITRIQLDAQDDRLERLREFLADREKLVEAARDRRIAELERQSERIAVTDEASHARALEVRLQLLAEQQAAEVQAVLNGNEFYIQAQGRILEARRDLQNAETDADRQAAQDRLKVAQQSAADVKQALFTDNDKGDATALFSEFASLDPLLAELKKKAETAQAEILSASEPAAKTAARNLLARLQGQINTQTDYLETLVETSDSTNKDLLILDKQHADAKVQVQEELGEELFSVREAGVEREIALEEAMAERKRDIAKKQYEAVIAGVSSGLDFNVDAELAEQLARLDEIKDEQLLSDESYQRRKTEIEEEAQRKRTLIAAQEEGARAALSIAAAEAELAAERDLLERKKAIAEELGLTEKAEALSADLELVKAQIQGKGSEIEAIATELSPKLGEAFAGMFTGNGEQAKEGFRDYFAGLASGLQQLAAAKISEVLLNSIGPGGFLGLAASFALRPLISAALGAITGPVVDKLLSFASGGRVDSPTLFVAGDASKLGGNDREWIFRDDQLKQLVAAVTQSNQHNVENRLGSIESLLAAWPTRLVAQGRDLVLATGREQESRRTIGMFAPA